MARVHPQASSPIYSINLIFFFPKRECTFNFWLGEASTALHVAFNHPSAFTQLRPYLHSALFISLIAVFSLSLSLHSLTHNSAPAPPSLQVFLPPTPLSFSGFSSITCSPNQVASTSSMLCSISTAKSGSNWLDRLRSNKGFPTEDNLGLDHYLRSHSNPDPSDAPIATNASNSLNSNSEPTRSDANPVPDRAKISSESKDRDKDENGEWFGVMTNVLSELFNMGGPNRSSTFSGKKSSRKQTNPKYCVIPSPNNLPVEEAETATAKGSGVVRNDEHAQPATASLNSDNNKSAETKNESRDDNIVECEVDVEEEKEKGEKELLGYSRSEVTVIDTSFGVWKFDKLVYRRKNVWKVRDKKGKSRVAGRKKKRKGNVSDGNLVASKKAKVCTPVLESDAKNYQESNRAHFHGQNPHCKREEVSNEILGNVCQAPKTRLPRKSQKEGSSVVGRFPTSKKSGANLRKGRPKDTNRQ